MAFGIYRWTISASTLVRMLVIKLVSLALCKRLCKISKKFSALTQAQSIMHIYRIVTNVVASSHQSFPAFNSSIVVQEMGHNGG